MAARKVQRSLAEHLRDARIKSGHSQWAIARMIGLSSPQYISNIERGICGPPISRLKAYATAIGLDPLELLTEIHALQLEEFKKASGIKTRSQST